MYFWEQLSATPSPATKYCARAEKIATVREIAVDRVQQTPTSVDRVALIAPAQLAILNEYVRD
jgi:hypothetical protein